MVNAAVVLQSLLQLTALASEVALVMQRIQNGEEISEADWETLRIGVDDANANWESA